MKKHEKVSSEVNRRDFIKGGSFATLMTLMGGVALKAQEKPKTEPANADEKRTGTTVKCAVIGCGVWGRELLKTLALLPNAPVVGICDIYEPLMRRAKEFAPKAEEYSDYQKVLAQKEVQAVFVATPSHLHRDITLAALQAGKHVYCEAPLATTIEDARAIAKAAMAANKQVFQSGQQNRSDPQRYFLLQFIRAGAMGKTIKARCQWNKKQSWRRPAPTPEREKAINWRLLEPNSLGLIGEIGVHQVDMANWFINARPVSVTGFGGILQWNDGRIVPDTIQAVFEYPGGVNLGYDSTLANSFDAEYEMYYGTDAAIMIRENKAWMFKEVDSPLLGWEVYARKDSFYKETGIALVANATKLAAQGAKVATDATPDNETPLFYALEAFITNSGEISTAAEDFISSFGAADAKALAAHLDKVTRLPSAGYKEAYEAAVAVIKANEAILKGQKIVFEKEWFEIA